MFESTNGNGYLRTSGVLSQIEGAHFVLLVFRKGQINFRSFQASNIIQINGALISKMFENH